MHTISQRRILEGTGRQERDAGRVEDAGMKPKTSITSTYTEHPRRSAISRNKSHPQCIRRSAYNLNISSTKSMTGHCLGAAWVLEALACIMAVCNDIVPPTINHFTDDPGTGSPVEFHVQ